MLSQRLEIDRAGGPIPRDDPAHAHAAAHGASDGMQAVTAGREAGNEANDDGNSDTVSGGCTAGGAAGHHRAEEQELEPGGFIRNDVSEPALAWSNKRQRM